MVLMRLIAEALDAEVSFVTESSFLLLRLYPG
jgi:hypothetical protein